MVSWQYYSSEREPQQPLASQPQPIHRICHQFTSHFDRLESQCRLCLDEQVRQH